MTFICCAAIIWTIVLFKYWTKKVSLECPGCIFMKGGPIVLREVTAHWMDSLVPSLYQKDVVYVHFYAPTGRGGKKYICTPEAQCKFHR